MRLNSCYFHCSRLVITFTHSPHLLHCLTYTNFSRLCNYEISTLLSYNEMSRQGSCKMNLHNMSQSTLTEASYSSTFIRNYKKTPYSLSSGIKKTCLQSTTAVAIVSLRYIICRNLPDLYKMDFQLLWQ
jgi:hypothetical protein